MLMQRTEIDFIFFLDNMVDNNKEQENKKITNGTLFFSFSFSKLYFLVLHYFLSNIKESEIHWVVICKDHKWNLSLHSRALPYMR